MRRTFIAVKIDAGAALLALFSSFKTGLNDESIKWTKPDNIHITLVFIGDTEEKKIKEVRSVLKEKCEGSGSFEFIIRGAGVFKNYSDPHVIWTGIDPSEKLAQLSNRIAEGLRQSGFNIEERAFRPHLTLGRIRKLNDKAKLKSMLEEYKDTEIQKVAVNEVILFESILLPTGPVYKPIAEYKL